MSIRTGVPGQKNQFHAKFCKLCHYSHPDVDIGIRLCTVPKVEVYLDCSNFSNSGQTRVSIDLEPSGSPVAWRVSWTDASFQLQRACQAVLNLLNPFMKPVQDRGGVEVRG